MNNHPIIIHPNPAESDCGDYAACENCPEDGTCPLRERDEDIALDKIRSAWEADHA